MKNAIYSLIILAFSFSGIAQEKYLSEETQIKMASMAAPEEDRDAGMSTMMGNPIDIAYDNKTKTIFIAEIGNGKILGFTDVLNATGDVAPAIENDLEAAASIYLYNN